MKRIKSNRIILEDRIISGYVYYDKDKIVEVSDKELAFDEEYDFTDLYVSPGFIDTHTHGGGGSSFNGTLEDIIVAADFHAQHGTTTILPTISAAPMDFMGECGKKIKKAKDEKLTKNNILGSHMEGPFLNAAQCGGQVPDFIVPPSKPDYVRWIDELDGSIARWSYAPENDENGEFCQYLSDHGIIPSAGHTDALYSDMMLAKSHGMHLVTHLYSCTSTITRDHGFRRLGVIESAYLDDDMYVEIIADGKHLPPDLIKMIIKIKGTDKVMLCTDSLMYAGAKEIKNDENVIIEDGVCKLANRTAFAGSIATADVLIRVITKDAGFSLTEAVKMLTKIPARIHNLNKGSLKAGYDADIVVFDDDISVKKVFVMGALQKF